jgi:hypothetical protein
MAIDTDYSKDKWTFFRGEFPMHQNSCVLIDTKEKYIKELERQICEQQDRINFDDDQWYNYWIPQRLMWKQRAMKAEAELRVMKKYIEDAQRLTNRDLKDEIDEQKIKEKENQGK